MREREGRADAENTSRHRKRERDGAQGAASPPSSQPELSMAAVMSLLISIMGGVGVGERQRGERECSATQRDATGRQFTL